MRIDCDICFTVEGKLDIFKNGQLVYASVPIAWLECYLAPHGIRGEDYKNVVDQLNHSGKAVLKIPNPTQPGRERGVGVKTRTILSSS